MSDTPSTPAPERKTSELEPIDDVIQNLQAEGKDKYQIAAELKRLTYRSKDIAAKLGISMRDIGVKLKATQSGNPEEITRLVADVKVLEHYQKEVGQLTQAELVQMVETRMATRYLDKIAAKYNMNTARYITVATGFYENFHSEFSDMYEKGEIGIPMMSVEINE